jgi:hypothetical protein
VVGAVSGTLAGVGAGTVVGVGASAGVAGVAGGAPSSLEVEQPAAAAITSVLASSRRRGERFLAGISRVQGRKPSWGGRYPIP